MNTPPSTWRPMDPIDRSWSGIEYVRSLVDLDVPAPDRLRAALAGLATVSPEVGRWASAQPPRWAAVTDHDRDRWLDAVLQVVDEPGADAARTFELNRAPLGALPFRLLLGPDWFSVRMTHALGDGYTVNAFTGHLLRRAHADGAVAIPWTTVTARGRDRAIARDVARNLGTAIGAVRHRAELAGGEYEPAALHVDAMTDTTLTLASRPGLPAELRALRDRWFPGASGAAVAKVGLRAALASVLPEPRPGFECLFNTRTEATATSWGNWSAGVFLRPTDDYSPVATTLEMSRVRDSGLAALGCASLRLRGARASSGAGDQKMVAARAGRPRLTLSYMPKHALADIIPGLRPGRSVLGTVSTPNGADTITVQAIELADRLSLGVSFYPEVWARADVQAAMEGFLRDPISCLARSLPVGARTR